MIAEPESDPPSSAKPFDPPSSAKPSDAQPSAKPSDAPQPSASPSGQSVSPTQASDSAPSRPSEATSSSAGKESAESEALIPIDLFAKIDLRVATVLHVEPHPNADRLLKLQIDLGSERRQLVAGLASHYRPEDLIGKQIVVVANLMPAKLRGELSQGMLLAASDSEGVAILSPERPTAPGSQVR